MVCPFADAKILRPWAQNDTCFATRCRPRLVPPAAKSVHRFRTSVRTSTEAAARRHAQAAGGAPSTAAERVRSALTNRHRGSEGPAMHRRRTPGTADGLLVFGLAVCMIGLVAVTSALEDPGVVGRPGGHGAPAAVSPDRRLASSVASSGRRLERDDRRERGDARLYLREAAAAAHRRARPGPEQGETRSALWINAPGSIGSTSPPGASPVNQFGDEE